MDLNNIWNSFLDKIKNQISDIAFETWFSDVYVILFAHAFAALFVLTISLIRTHRKKKVSVPDEVI